MTSIDDDLDAIFGVDPRSDAWLQRFSTQRRYPDEPEVDSYALYGLRLVGEVASGGQGIVYRAQDAVSGSHLALKRLRAPARFAAVVRLEREILALTRLRHPGIVRVHDVIDHGEVKTIVMDWIDGRSIDAWTTHRVQPTKLHELLRVFAEVCDAVHYAHQRGVLHRDLKPSNILIDDRSDTPRIIDFGIAKFMDEATVIQLTSITETHEYCGTVRYSCPEVVAEGSRAYTIASEVYSLGVVLYELVSGRPPYDLGVALSEAIRAGLTQGFNARFRLTRRCTRALRDIFERSLARAPRRRYPTVADLADAARRLAASAPD